MPYRWERKDRYEELVGSFLEGRGRNRDRGDDIDSCGKFHPVFGVCIVWIEWKCVDKSY